MAERPRRTAGSHRLQEFSDRRVAESREAGKVVCAEALQQVVKPGPVVVMPQMRQLVKQDIVAQRLGQTDEIEIETQIPSGRAAAPVGDIVPHGHFPIPEPVSFREKGEPCREQRRRLGPEYAHEGVQQLRLTGGCGCRMPGHSRPVRSRPLPGSQ